MARGLSAHNITYAFERRPPVIRDLSAHFPAGSVAALIGPNGAGKTTLVRLLAGLLQPDRGRVTLDDADIASWSARAERIAYIPQRARADFDFTALDVVGFGRPGTRDDRAATAALERVDGAALAGSAFRALSAGQQQRVALARALHQISRSAGGSTALLADEPASAMDPKHAVMTMRLLREVAASGTAVVAVMHDLSAAARWADEVFVLSESHRLDAPRILEASALEPVYGIPFHVGPACRNIPVVIPDPDAGRAGGRH